MSGNCQSCDVKLYSGNQVGVPSYAECCRRCWNRVPIHERLRLSIAVRDRMPGGVFSEISCAASSFLELQQKAEEES